MWSRKKIYTAPKIQHPASSIQHPTPAHLCASPVFCTELRSSENDGNLSIVLLCLHLTIKNEGDCNRSGRRFCKLHWIALLELPEDPHADPVFKNSFLNTDVLYRAGETQQGILTYTPRLVSVDFQGSLGSLGSSSSLYNEIPSSDPSLVATWSGNVSRHVSEPHKKNLFLQSLDDGMPVQANDVNKEKDYSQGIIQDKDRVECLENDVQYWTDFSKVHYHPRSLYELNCSWTDVNEFNNYGIGKDALSGTSQSEEMSERLRFFVEDCDHIQGIQFIVDDSGGFSGVATDFLENIADEYANTPVLLYAARGPTISMNKASQKMSILTALHDAVSFSKLSSFCKLMVPVGLPFLSTNEVSNFLCMQDAKPFYSSAVYAAALHSITLPFRMELLGPTATSNFVSGAVDVGGMIHILADQARQNPAVILDVAMPAPPLTVGERELSFQRNLHSLTPEVAEDLEDLHQVESMIIHGALHQGGCRASISEVKDLVNDGHQSREPKPRFSHLSVALSPLPIPLPFPSIFGNRVGPNGELLGSPIPVSQPRGSLDVHSVPMAARLRSSSAILPFVEKRLGNLRKFGINRGARGLEVLRSWGFQKDDVDDMGEALSKIVMALDPHSEISSDSD